MSAPTPPHKNPFWRHHLSRFCQARPKGCCTGVGSTEAPAGLAIVHAAREHPGPLLVVTRGVHAAEQLEDEIRFYAAQDSAPGVQVPVALASCSRDTRTSLYSAGTRLQGWRR